MQICRIYTDAKGETHFSEIKIELQDAGAIGLLSQLESASGIIFRETEGNYHYQWHNAPRRQYVIILEGRVDFTVSDGECRRFGAGDVVLLEDVAGKGHCSQAVDGELRKSIFVTLD
ncbi:MAG: cupin domain-containing protein [Pseudomonadota bacterium]|nr:cupin domain-containing protein [Pseudomonadota bacterium]